LKIAQVVPLMNVGGVERGTIDLAVYLNKQGIENIIVSGGGRLLESPSANGLRHATMNVYRKSLFTFFTIAKMRSLLKEEAVNIVHARSRVPAWVSFFASRGSEAHFLTTAHGVYTNKSFSEVMGWGKFVICPSKVVARHLKKKFGVPDEKIVVINRWVDTQAFPYTDYSRRKNSNIILTFGRISPSKGYEYLIEAFKRVVRFNPYMRLHIVGSPDKSKINYYKYLQGLVSRYALQYNVKFIGFQSDVAAALAEARMMVAPSVTEESFGRVIIEAFSCGVPVIATKVGGYKEIIDAGRDGILVDPGNPGQIADAMIRILEDKEAAGRLTVKAKEKVDKSFTIDKCLLEVTDVYRKALAISRIAVVKLSSLGDLILAVPSLKLLREKNPQARISLITSRRYSALFLDCSYIDELIPVDDSFKKLKSISESARFLRRKSFDYIIDLQNNRISHLLSFLAFPRYSFGYNLRWGFLLSKRVAYDRSLDPLTSQEKILQLLGLRFKEKKLVFWDKKGNESLVLPEGNLIGINVSASARWRSKNWPIANIGKLIDLICKNIPGSFVVLLGDDHSRALTSSLAQAADRQVLDLCGKTTMADLPAIISKLRVFLTPDTAALHLALALGVPTLALFGPTDHSRHSVKSENLHIFSEKLSCSYCYKKRCKFSQESLCLVKITPQQVFSKIKSLL
jgi:ADP-heptose:LPS heptosyltransferase/glycosyltransferase involved in cell wall biosynthesis